MPPPFMKSPPTAEVANPLRAISRGAADCVFQLVLMTSNDEVQARVLDTARLWAALDRELLHPTENTTHA